MLAEPALLGSVLQGDLDLATRLDLAIAMAGELAALHERGVIHRALQPIHIRVDVPTRRAWITESETGTIGLPYLAPEQTGRMNRAVDSRTDLYVLGVILYEMFAATLPWSASSPAEWMHSHVARRPAAMPDTVPSGLAAIVEKLLAKSPDDRYQTAAGLQADLVRARDTHRTGDIAPFPLGEHDLPQRLHPPGTTYGRADPLRRLAGALDRVAASGMPELV
ncbi:MAG TPA: protein kinase, partial [Kofleriaceae bacterium]